MALTADAFEVAERYRTPVIILTDGILGQAMEPVELVFREPPRVDAPWATTGADGRPPRVVRSLHLKPEDLEAHNRHLQAKYAAIGEREVRHDGEHLDDADLVIVAYGTAARVARTAISRLSGWTMSVTSMAVPPVEISSTPAAARAWARGRRPDLSETERSAVRMGMRPV